MKKAIVLLALVAAGYASTTRSTYAANWDWSYTFSDGDVVGGSFVGTEFAGGVVEDLSDISVYFTPSGGSTTDMAGPIYAATYNGSSWVPGAVLSLDGLENNFAFANGDVADGGSYTEDASFIGVPSGLWAQAWSSAEMDDAEYGANATGWFLADPPSVPDGGSTAVLCGMGLVALGWMRRRLG